MRGCRRERESSGGSGRSAKNGSIFISVSVSSLILPCSLLGLSLFICVLWLIEFHDARRDDELFVLCHVVVMESKEQCAANNLQACCLNM
jgi:hypothetical protein